MLKSFVNQHLVGCNTLRLPNPAWGLTKGQHLQFGFCDGIFCIFLTLLCGNMCFWVYVFKTISHNHSPANIEISEYKTFFYMCTDIHFLIADVQKYDFLNSTGLVCRQALGLAHTPNQGGWGWAWKSFTKKHKMYEVATIVIQKETIVSSSHVWHSNL